MGSSQAARFEALVAEAEEASIKCPVGLIIVKLNRDDPDAAEALLRAISIPAISHRTLHSVLRESGYRTSRESISKHRCGSCECKDTP